MIFVSSLQNFEKVLFGNKYILHLHIQKKIASPILLLMQIGKTFNCLGRNLTNG